jgi:hypothetical protein
VVFPIVLDGFTYFLLGFLDVLFHYQIPVLFGNVNEGEFSEFVSGFIVDDLAICFGSVGSRAFDYL